MTDWVADFLVQHPHLVGAVLIGPYLLVAVVALACLLLVTILGGADR